MIDQINLSEFNDVVLGYCLVGELDPERIYPIGKYSGGAKSYVVVKLVTKKGNNEIGTNGISPALQSLDRLMEWINCAFEQYEKNIKPESLDDRFSNYPVIFEDGSRLTKDGFSRIIQREGILPFLRMKGCYIFPNDGKAFYEFECDVEEYLSDYGFCFVVIFDQCDRVEFFPLDVMLDLIREIGAR